MTPYAATERRILRRTWDRIIRHLEKHGASHGLCNLLDDYAPSSLYSTDEKRRLHWMMGRSLQTAYFWPLGTGVRERDETPRILAAVWMRETLDNPWGEA